MTRIIQRDFVIFAATAVLFVSIKKSRIRYSGFTTAFPVLGTNHLELRWSILAVANGLKVESIGIAWYRSGNNFVVWLFGLISASIYAFSDVRRT